MSKKNPTQKMVQVAVGKDVGMVVIKFDRDINYLELNPEPALDFAEAISKEAFEARDGVKLAGPALKAGLIEKHKLKLTPRIALLLNSLREDKTKTNQYLSEQIISTIFSEIF